MKANNVSAIPNAFIRCKGGFANEVYLDKTNDLILKIYSKGSYYEAEMRAFDSGFSAMPERIEHGFIDKRPYIVMTHIGTEIKHFGKNDIPSLTQTLAELHRHKKYDSREPIENKFQYLNRYQEKIKDVSGVDIGRLIGFVSKYCRSENGLSLTHGDVTLSNLRELSGKIFLIDFDEAAYFSPYFDIAKLYWSDLPPFQTLAGLEHFMDTYNRIGQESLRLDEKAKDWIMLAGIDFWIWRDTHLNDSPLAFQAESRLREYRKIYENR